jgi:site-specific DNA recombinase
MRTAIGKSANEALAQATSERVALYSRVSTEDQTDRGTIQAQRAFLTDFARLYGLEIGGEYVDDGFSGTIALDHRPDGARLLEDARQGRFGTVLVYRLDRLGRSLTALLEAHMVLAAAGVTIRSATEPFDTSTPIGRFLFQLLGSLAELEKSTISERMSMGRDRVARAGKWTNGPIPFGYDLDAEGC